MCVCLQYVCDFNFTRALWHLDILYVLAGVCLMTEISRTVFVHRRTFTHTHTGQDSVNCVCGFFWGRRPLHAWRRDPCRLERLPIMRKQVTSLKDHTCAPNVFLSLTHTDVELYNPFSNDFSMLRFLIYKCTNYTIFHLRQSFTHCVWAAPYAVATKGTEYGQQEVFQGIAQSYLPLVSLDLISIIYEQRETQFLKRYEMDVEVGRYVCWDGTPSIKRLDSLSNPKLFPVELVTFFDEHGLSHSWNSHSHVISLHSPIVL